MTKKGGERVRYIYGVCFSLLTAIVGVLFIWQVWSIYRSAPKHAFTVENISMHFKQIAVPVWLWVAAVVGSIVLAIVYPEREARPKAFIDLERSIARTKKRLPTEGEYAAQMQAVERTHSKARHIICGVACGGIVLALAFAVTILTDLIYLPIIKAEFFASHNGLADRLVQCAVLVIVALTGGCIAAELRARSLKKEQKAYLNILVEAKKAGVTPLKGESKKEEQTDGKSALYVRIVRIGLCAVGVAFVVWGICNGGMKDVLLKAINICTQCIGLG